MRFSHCLAKFNGFLRFIRRLFANQPVEPAADFDVGDRGRVGILYLHQTHAQLAAHNRHLRRRIGCVTGFRYDAAAAAVDAEHRSRRHAQHL